MHAECPGCGRVDRVAQPDEDEVRCPDCGEWFDPHDESVGSIDGRVFGHETERLVRTDDVRYRCVVCGLSSDLVSDFDRYGCEQ